MSHQATTWVMELSNSKLADRLVLLAIAHRVSNDTGAAFPSLATICHEARVSKRTAQCAIKRLCELGDMEIEAGGNGPGDTHTFRMPKFQAWQEQIRSQAKGADFAPLRMAKGAKSAPLCDKKGRKVPQLRAQSTAESPHTPLYGKTLLQNHQGTKAAGAAAALVLTSEQATGREKHPPEAWGELAWVRGFLDTQQVLRIPHDEIHRAAPGYTLYDPGYWRLLALRCGGRLTPELLRSDFAGMAIWLANNPQKRRLPAGWRAWISKWLVRTVAKEISDAPTKKNYRQPGQKIRNEADRYAGDIARGKQFDKLYGLGE